LTVDSAFDIVKKRKYKEGKMVKNLKTLLLGIFYILGLFSLSFAEEKITITTFYPSPFGSYRQLTSDQIAIGTNYRNPTYADGTLFVENKVGVGTVSPEGLQINAAITETARGSDNVRLGVLSGSPRIVFEDNTYTQWEIDNSGGNLRIFQPSSVKVSIADSTGNVVISGTLTVNGAQGGAADHVFDNYDDIELLRKWRKGESLPFETGDILNRDSLLRDAIMQLAEQVEQQKQEIALLKKKLQH